jgi:ABC-type sugar transport system substrate-binding protein
MKKPVFKIAIAFVQLAAALALVPAGHAARKLDVLVVAVSEMDVSYPETVKAATDWGKSVGANVTVAAPLLPSASDQQKILEEKLADGWDVICIEPLGVPEISPLLENARDRGSVVITLRGRSFPAADYNIEPFSGDEMGERMIDALAEAMNSEGAYITLIPSFEAQGILDIENAAVRKQRQRYDKMSIPRRLETTGADASRARGAVRRGVERYSVKGVMFFTSADGLGAAEHDLGDRLAAVGLGDRAVLKDHLERGNIDRLFYWSRANLVLAGLEFGRAAAAGRRFGASEPVSLAIEGYETIRSQGGNNWVARDIRTEPR